MKCLDSLHASHTDNLILQTVQTLIRLAKCWLSSKSKLFDMLNVLDVVFLKKIVSEYDQEIPQSTNCRQPCGTPRKSRSTITRHQEDKLSKATSSLFPIKMIAIQERTQSNVQQNIEQLQTPTMGVTINKKSTTTEPPP